MVMTTQRRLLLSRDRERDREREREGTRILAPLKGWDRNWLLAGSFVVRPYCLLLLLLLVVVVVRSGRHGGVLSSRAPEKGPLFVMVSLDARAPGHFQTQKYLLEMEGIYVGGTGVDAVSDPIQ